MSSDHIIKMKGLTLPSSESTHDVEFGVTVLGINVKTRMVEFVIDWLEYRDDETLWKRMPDSMINLFEWRYALQIRDKLLALQEEIDYNDAEDNPYPDW